MSQRMIDASYDNLIVQVTVGGESDCWPYDGAKAKEECVSRAPPKSWER